MKNKLPLKKAVENVLQCQKDAGHPESYVIDMRRTFNRLLRLAVQRRETFFSEELALSFLEDNKNSRTGEYCHNRFLAHNRCIRLLRSYLDTGKAIRQKYHEPIDTDIADGFLEALA